MYLQHYLIILIYQNILKLHFYYSIKVHIKLIYNKF